MPSPGFHAYIHFCAGAWMSESFVLVAKYQRKQGREQYLFREALSEPKIVTFYLSASSLANMLGDDRWYRHFPFFRVLLHSGEGHS